MIQARRSLLTMYQGSSSALTLLNSIIVCPTAKMTMIPSGARAMSQPRAGTQVGGMTPFHMSGLNRTRLKISTAYNHDQRQQIMKRIIQSVLRCRRTNRVAIRDWLTSRLGGLPANC